MTRFTAQELKKAVNGETYYFHFDEGIVSWNPDVAHACGSRWYQGKIFDRTSRYVLWGDEHYTITDLETGEHISTDSTEELWSIPFEEIQNLKEPYREEALDAIHEKRDFDILWSVIKANNK